MDLLPIPPRLRTDVRSTVFRGPSDRGGRYERHRRRATQTTPGSAHDNTPRPERLTIPFNVWPSCPLLPPLPLLLLPAASRISCISSSPGSGTPNPRSSGSSSIPTRPITLRSLPIASRYIASAEGISFSPSAVTARWARSSADWRMSREGMRDLRRVGKVSDVDELAVVERGREVCC